MEVSQGGEAGESPSDQRPVTDGQRQIAISRLREALAAKAISSEEYTSRLEVAYGATTLDQLDLSLRWLAGPGVDAAAPPPTPPAPPHRRPPTYWLLAIAAAALFGVGATVVVMDDDPPPRTPSTEAVVDDPDDPPRTTSTDAVVDDPGDRSTEQETAGGVAYQPHPDADDLAPILVFDYDGDGSEAPGSDTPGSAADVATEYLAALVARDFERMGTLLCAPLRSEFPDAEAIEARLYEEFDQLPNYFDMDSQPSAAGNVRYSVSGSNWGQSPLELRAVPEGGKHRVCGTGIEDARLGFLASGALGY